MSNLDIFAQFELNCRHEYALDPGRREFRCIHCCALEPEPELPEMPAAPAEPVAPLSADARQAGGLFGADELPLDLRPPAEFQRYDKNLAYDFKCPRCRYRWSGNALASAEEVGEQLEGENP